MTGDGAKENYGVVSCRGSSNSRKQIIEGEYRRNRDGNFSPKRRIHVQTTEIFTDCLQFL